MKALNDKIIEALKVKHDSFIGTEGQQIRDDFKKGLMWAIDTIETLTEGAEFEEVARQLMKHLGDWDRYHPHHTAIITNTNAELVEGVRATGKVMDYIGD